jgi:hypothetical protein
MKIYKITKLFALFSIIASIVLALYITFNILPTEDGYLSKSPQEFTMEDAMRIYNRSSDEEPNDALTKKLSELTDYYVNMAIDMFGIDIVVNVKVSYSIRNMEYYAAAIWLPFLDNSGKIKPVGIIAYNHTLLSNTTDDIVEEVVAHEVAHLVSYYLGEDNFHNEKWASYCKQLMPSASCRETI